VRADRQDSAEISEEIYRLVCQSKRALVLTATHALEARNESIFTWQIVSWIARNGPTTQRDLSYVLAQHPAGISRQVNDLEAQGLVRRKLVADRRKLLVEITVKGGRWFRAISAEVMDAVDHALAGLTAGERRDLRKLMRSMVETLGEKGRGNPKPYPTRRTKQPAKAESAIPA
jgi:DNA-binding MarR family transcriptional regulator